MAELLCLTDPRSLRDALAAAFPALPSTEVCWQLGRQAATPGTAFFIGYQAAMRCLDPELPHSSWAAFCISERGVRDPRLMQTQFDDQAQRLVGHKSYAMFAGRGLDYLYIVARSGEDLVALKLAAEQVTVLPGSVQSFLPDVPHGSISFDLVVPQDAIVCRDAHRRLNKPFRYWEDVHVALALAGWLSRFASVNEQAVHQLMTAFHLNARVYDLHALDAVESLLAELQRAASDLPEPEKTFWQRDAVFLRLTQPVRDAIRGKLTAR